MQYYAQVQVLGFVEEKRETLLRLRRTSRNGCSGLSQDSWSTSLFLERIIRSLEFGWILYVKPVPRLSNLWMFFKERLHSTEEEAQFATEVVVVIGSTPRAYGFSGMVDQYSCVTSQYVEIGSFLVLTPFQVELDSPIMASFWPPTELSQTEMPPRLASSFVQRSAEWFGGLWTSIRIV